MNVCSSDKFIKEIVDIKNRIWTHLSNSNCFKEIIKVKDRKNHMKSHDKSYLFIYSANFIPFSFYSIDSLSMYIRTHFPITTYDVHLYNQFMQKVNSFDFHFFPHLLPPIIFWKFVSQKRIFLCSTMYKVLIKICSNFLFNIT